MNTNTKAVLFSELKPGDRFLTERGGAEFIKIQSLKDCSFIDSHAARMQQTIATVEQEKK
jgi:hypothetical protein